MPAASNRCRACRSARMAALGAGSGNQSATLLIRRASVPTYRDAGRFYARAGGRIRHGSHQKRPRRAPRILPNPSSRDRPRRPGAAGAGRNHPPGHEHGGARRASGFVRAAARVRCRGRCKNIPGGAHPPLRRRQFLRHRRWRRGGADRKRKKGRGGLVRAAASSLPRSPAQIRPSCSPRRRRRTGRRWRAPA